MTVPAERGHRRRQPAGPAPGGRGDGDLGHHGPRGPPVQPGERRGSQGRRDRHHDHLRRGAAPRRRRGGVHHRGAPQGDPDAEGHERHRHRRSRTRPASTTPRRPSPSTPTSDLAEGAVYVAISADHWDAAGNKGSAHTATFTVDATAPAAPTFSPANAADGHRRHDRHHDHLRRGAPQATATGRRSRPRPHLARRSLRSGPRTPAARPSCMRPPSTRPRRSSPSTPRATWTSARSTSPSAPTTGTPPATRDPCAAPPSR